MDEAAFPTTFFLFLLLNESWTSLPFVSKEYRCKKIERRYLIWTNSFYFLECYIRTNNEADMQVAGGVQFPSRFRNVIWQFWASWGCPLSLTKSHFYNFRIFIWNHPHPLRTKANLSKLFVVFRDGIVFSSDQINKIKQRF